jgi:tetratricopeptide (TPR) repeat protein
MTMASPSPSPQQQAAVSPFLARIAAQPQIDFELDFFNALLERRPDYLEVLKAHAKNLALARRHQDGLQCDLRITRLRPQDALARYNLACSLTLTRHYDQAIVELRRAVELGYRDFAFMRQDRDLDPIRRDPRFRALMREYERKR